MSGDLKFAQLASLKDGSDFLPAGSVLFVGAGAPDELIAPPTTQRIRYYHQDHLGSSNVLANAEGGILQASVFYPFGHPRRRDEMIAQTGVPGGRYLFSQKEIDGESGLQYFEARYMAGHLGRFARVDPLAVHPPADGLEDPRRLNPYSYALNSPNHFFDPDGAEPIPVPLRNANCVIKQNLMGRVFDFGKIAGITITGGIKRIDRSAFAEQLTDRTTMEMFAARVSKEAGGQSEEAQRAVIETIFNRAAARGQSLKTSITSKYYGAAAKTPGQLKEDTERGARIWALIREVAETGSNITLGSTGNASGTVGFGWGKATRQKDGTYWAPGQLVTFDGERFARHRNDVNWTPPFLPDEPTTPATP